MSSQDTGVVVPPTETEEQHAAVAQPTGAVSSPQQGMSGAERRHSRLSSYHQLPRHQVI